MKNIIAGTVCAGLFAMSASSTVNAATVAMDFSGSNGFANYVFDVQDLGIDGTVFNLISANINGTVFDSSYIFNINDFEVTDLMIYNSQEQLVSSLTFDGYFQAENGILGMFYYGDGLLHTGSAYEFSSPGINQYMLYDQSSSFGLTDVSVNQISAVPVPAAVWLFGSGLIGLAGIARRKV